MNKEQLTFEHQFVLRRLHVCNSLAFRFDQLTDYNRIKDSEHSNIAHAEDLDHQQVSDIMILHVDSLKHCHHSESKLHNYRVSHSGLTTRFLIDIGEK
jgi:hypothetical protein